MATAAFSVSTRARLLQLALATLGLLAALALFIHPGSGTAATSCLGSGATVFRPWLDPAPYVLAPGGDFETVTAGGWRFTGKAQPFRGNEPWRVHSGADQYSLSIPAGASATTPPLCVGLGDPTLRFFTTGAHLTSFLKVEVIYRTKLGTLTQPVAVLPGGSAWAPTPPLPFLANATGLLSLDGLTSSVQFRFTATGTRGFLVDDLYVDPWKIGGN